MKWLAHKSGFRGDVELLLVDDYGGCKLGYGTPTKIMIESREREAIIEEPTLKLDAAEGQSLMQALWDAGLRPNNGEGSGAEVTALKNHIGFAEHVSRTLLATKL